MLDYASAFLYNNYSILKKIKEEEMKRRLLMIASFLAFVFILASCGSKTFTVTFESNGGSTVEAISVKKDEKVTKPTDPTKDGYDFGGWFKEESLTTEWKFQTDTVTA